MQSAMIVGFNRILHPIHRWKPQPHGNMLIDSNRKKHHLLRALQLPHSVLISKHHSSANEKSFRLKSIVAMATIPQFIILLLEVQGSTGDDSC
jgi:hypothetical protein